MYDFWKMLSLLQVEAKSNYSVVSNRQSYFLALDVPCFYLIMETLSAPETSDIFL
jgi:hypothetical protein